MGITNENLESIEQRKTQSITITTTIPNTQSMQNYHYGASSILSEYIFLFVISLILGGLIGLILSLKENSKDLKCVAEALQNVTTRVEYIDFDKNTNSAKFVRLPERNELVADIDESLIVEFYNR